YSYQAKQERFVLNEHVHAIRRKGHCFDTSPVNNRVAAAWIERLVHQSISIQARGINAGQAIYHMKCAANHDPAIGLNERTGHVVVHSRRESTVQGAVGFQSRDAISHLLIEPREQTAHNYLAVRLQSDR